jgi:hypothetical protein
MPNMLRARASYHRVSWTPAVHRHDNQVIKIKFSSARLQALCVEDALHKPKAAPSRFASKSITSPCSEPEPARYEPAFREIYRMRSGIEGTISTFEFGPLGCAVVALLALRKRTCSTSSRRRPSMSDASSPGSSSRRCVLRRFLVLLRSLCNTASMRRKEGR